MSDDEDNATTNVARLGTFGQEPFEPSLQRTDPDVQGAFYPQTIFHGCGRTWTVGILRQE